MRVYIDQHVGIAIPGRCPADSVGPIDKRGCLRGAVTGCGPAGAEVRG
jgi:hypothetical protein